MSRLISDKFKEWEAECDARFNQLKENEVGTPFKELQQVLPGLNRNQIQVLMRELKEDEKVVCKGKTSAARWFIIK